MSKKAVGGAFSKAIPKGKPPALIPLEIKTKSSVPKNGSVPAVEKKASKVQTKSVRFAGDDSPGEDEGRKPAPKPGSIKNVLPSAKIVHDKTTEEKKQDQQQSSSSISLKPRYQSPAQKRPEEVHLKPRKAKTQDYEQPLNNVANNLRTTGQEEGHAQQLKRNKLPNAATSSGSQQVVPDDTTTRRPKAVEQQQVPPGSAA
ncbi:unnamed protein product, partial [Amoebophrya sp. A120]|eukprot:GSA120T00001809001.1